MKFKKNVRKSPIILLKSGQSVTMDTRLYNHKNETRLKDYSNKGKGKSQNKNVLWKIVTMVTNNKTRQQCSTRDRQKVCDENLITEPTGPGFV